MYQTVKKCFSCIVSILVFMLCLLNCGVLGNVSAESGEYRYWRQNDDRWNYLPVGDYYNVGSVGCLITSFAMIAVHSGTMTEEEMNPGIFTEGINSVDGFTNWGILIWDAIPKVVPGMTVVDKRSFYYSTPSGKADEMQWWIDEGYYVICHCVDYYDSTGYYHSHWVFVEGAADGTVYMMDPASDEYSMFDTYYSGYATEYMVIQCEDHPAENFVVYGASIDISINSLPYKIDYEVGEELDLTGGEAVVRGTGYMGEEWELEPEDIGEANSFLTITDEFDSSTPGTYNIYLYTIKNRAEETISFPVYVLDPDTGERVYPPETTTTTETTTTNTTTTTTETATTETTPVISAVLENTEQYCSNGTAVVDILAEPNSESDVSATIPNGCVVEISEIYGDYGLLSGELKGWVNISIMSPAESITYAKGDINNDGVVDVYDLALLNEYIKVRETFPEGVSIFTASELESADINSDGIIDNLDVFEYLDKIIL